MSARRTRDSCAAIIIEMSSIDGLLFVWPLFERGTINIYWKQLTGKLEQVLKRQGHAAVRDTWSSGGVLLCTLLAGRTLFASGPEDTTTKIYQLRWQQ
ncbi:Hypothetical protein CINCED_3A017038 [Cinara cedri]|uniref:Uncharacterized protein n=1 Tax=Cinara cedri TaxID=506608 RepID=A0A5E4MPQ3_9HEMI|nr:Hypothetical protein CINCED_3A017038 [Cinara cedri]